MEILTKGLEMINQDDKNVWENESKRRKLSTNRASGNKGKEKLKCYICNASFGLKSNFKKHEIIRTSFLSII